MISRNPKVKRFVKTTANKPKLLKTTDNRMPRKSAALFLQYNEHLGPPYHVILDTNFINFSIKNKLDIVFHILPIVFWASLKKWEQNLNLPYVIKDPRFERLVCLHKGTYADDCIVQRVTEAKCYIVATCDKDLKRRIRKIPGVPIMYITNHRYSIERLPDAYGAPKN
ncbi:rRNA-processing protein FCF1 -like protein [Trichinella pseudospiralis]|uniref:rRNA-processing protein FCF1-like protein n=1 Tax=Trichinella pseudospiralis TaxID=6337 RepID=A0A0V0YIX7_TRIPS|nr:rRNA-processing protein FCF1 -like protein [Trichinella pseudospiralis]